MFALGDVAVPVVRQRLLIRMTDTMRPGDQLGRGFRATCIEPEDEMSAGFARGRLARALSSLGVVAPQPCLFGV